MFDFKQPIEKVLDVELAVETRKIDFHHEFSILSIDQITASSRILRNYVVKSYLLGYNYDHYLVDYVVLTGFFDYPQDSKEEVIEEGCNTGILCPRGSNRRVKETKRWRRRNISLSIAMECGGTLSEIYQSSRHLLLRTRDGLERLERLDASSSSFSSNAVDSPDLAFSIKKDISQIQSLCVEMDRMWRSISSKGQRDLWKRKVEQVAEEVDSLKESLDKHLLRNQKRMLEAKERAELLKRANGESAHVLRIFDEEAQAMQSARNSSLMLDEAYNTGVAVLTKYAEQRDRLKRAQRKALDILNTVGLSNSVLKIIERQHRVDKWIAYAGMIMTIILVYAFWRWTH
ncbi:membrin-11-like [Magnolia sinica]|uniref:membrin-11-like n=1 Tax=Magnolia sinica TaxID=86752 RepID=UPI002658910D|nr:membrin-11-like [Magnolia sinica]